MVRSLKDIVIGEKGCSVSYLVICSSVGSGGRRWEIVGAGRTREGMHSRVEEG